MAKIQDLTVQTINIANNSVTGVALSSDFGPNPLNLTNIPNALNLPITIVAGIVAVRSLPGSTDSAGFRLTVTNLNTGEIASQTSRSYSDSGSNTLSTSMLDATAVNNQSYQMTVSLDLHNGSGAATASVGEKRLRVLYEKR